MNLVLESSKLTPNQVVFLSQVLTTVSLQRQLGKPYRMTFTKAKNKSLGRLHRILKVLETCDDTIIDSMIDGICGIGENDVIK